VIAFNESVVAETLCTKSKCYGCYNPWLQYNTML